MVPAKTAARVACPGNRMRPAECFNVRLTIGEDDNFSGAFWICVALTHELHGHGHAHELHSVDCSLLFRAQVTVPRDLFIRAYRCSTDSFLIATAIRVGSQWSQVICSSGEAIMLPNRFLSLVDDRLLRCLSWRLDKRSPALPRCANRIRESLQAFTPLPDVHLHRRLSLDSLADSPICMPVCIRMAVSWIICSISRPIGIRYICRCCSLLNAPR